MAARKPKLRETHTGFHFWNAYQCCPRKWYFKYPCGIVPPYKAPELLFGGAFHDGKASFYTSGKESTAVSTFKRIMRSNKGEYYEEDRYNRDLYRGDILLRYWIDEWGKKDLKVYVPRLVEKELRATLPNGYTITVRPDTVVEIVKQGYWIALETKTTGYRVDVADAGVYYGDQATTQIYALKQNYPKKNVQGVIPDIAYWGKNSSNPTNITCYRGPLVSRNKSMLKDYENSTMSILSDMAQRVAALKEGAFPTLQLFPRNTAWCVSFNRVCEYAEICRKDIKIGDLPKGFKHDPWIEKPNLENIEKKLKRRRKVA